MKTAQNLDYKLWGLALLVAPILLILSSFFWQGKEYGITGGTILVFALVFWIPALAGLFQLLANKMPYYARISILTSIYSCVGGINFGFVGIYSSIFSISHETYIKEFSKHMFAANLLLFWPGPLFVFNLLILGVNLIRTRSVPTWVGVLICLGAITFPLSRILRIELVAHLSDGLLAIPLLYMGWIFISTKRLTHFQLNQSISI